MGLSKEQAKDLYDSGFWKDMTAEKIATFQLCAERLCMPFEVFHEALEEALGRPVWTHEMGSNWDGLKEELAGDEDPPSLREIIEMVPEEKRIILQADST